MGIYREEYGDAYASRLAAMLTPGWGGMIFDGREDEWPTQAWFWLEWGRSTAGQSLPTTLSCFRVVYSDSISIAPHSLLHSGQNV
jgi:hypothetical protein